jgi:hypothetical protein
VHRDGLDEVDPDCETVTPTLTPGPTPTPTAVPTRAPFPLPNTVPLATRAPISRFDRVAPTATLRVDARPRSLRVRSLGLAVRVTCDEPCSASASLRASSGTVQALKRRGVRAGGVVASGAKTDFAAGTRTVRVFLNASGRRALHRLVAGTYVVTVKVSDRAGNTRRLTQALSFR